LVTGKVLAFSQLFFLVIRTIYLMVVGMPRTRH
jgi:hypothetical protein